jgi:hypothetical protein
MFSASVSNARIIQEFQKSVCLILCRQAPMGAEPTRHERKKIKKTSNLTKARKSIRDRI